MPRTWLRLLMTVGLVLASGSARALDAHKAEILRLRLGMTEAEVAAVLIDQGIEVRPAQTPCSEGAEARCQREQTARTRDGALTIEFAAPAPTSAPVVQRVRYRLQGRAMGEATLVRGAMLAHYGLPVTLDPLAWCQPVPGVAGCTPAQPRLTFEFINNYTSLLALTEAEPAPP